MYPVEVLENKFFLMNFLSLDLHNNNDRIDINFGIMDLQSFLIINL